MKPCIRLINIIQWHFKNLKWFDTRDCDWPPRRTWVRCKPYWWILTVAGKALITKVGAIPPFLQFPHCCNLDMQNIQCLSVLKLRCSSYWPMSWDLSPDSSSTGNTSMCADVTSGTKKFKQWKQELGFHTGVWEGFFFQMNDLLLSSLDQGISHYLVMLKGSDIKGLPHPGWLNV